MGNLYIIVVAVVAVAHFAFIGYLVVGGFVALRWPRTIFLHIVAVVWALTELERWAGARAGTSPLPSDGFIAQYITGVLYRADAVGVVEGVVFAVVIVSWGLFAYAVVRGRQRSSLRP
jgi:hypothetical protein